LSRQASIEGTNLESGRKSKLKRKITIKKRIKSKSNTCAAAVGPETA
jgi:hypothetical protein